MSRVADAFVRAGRVDAIEHVASWDREKRAALQLLESTSAAQSSIELELATFKEESFEEPSINEASFKELTPTESQFRGVQDVAELDATQAELASLVRTLFLSSGPARIRSALFCTAAGEPLGDFAWNAAEILALQSGRRVGFVADGSRRRRRMPSAHAAGLTRIGWCRPATSTSRADAAVRQQRLDSARATDVKPDINSLGELVTTPSGEPVTNLFDHYDFVVVEATASRAEYLVPLASAVDGVILLISEGITRRGAAAALARKLRSSNIPLLGAVMRNRTYPIPAVIYRFL